ncbi:MAG: hypothetical protein ACXVDI_04860 [Ktedonobacterales bacterium]
MVFFCHEREHLWTSFRRLQGERGLDIAAYTPGEMKGAWAFVKRALTHFEQLGGDRGVGYLADAVGRNMARLCWPARNRHL